ncbi:MAG: M48 family metalloprotease [Candidatus Kapabacteria bacterium]|nr:M48 family metalloprotease [Candidatus Kapabacteria bacterium]
MQRYRAFLLRVVLILTLTFGVNTGVSSCSGGGVNLFGTDTDAQLGKQMDDQIRGNPAEYPIYRGNPAVKQYLQEMTNTIVRSEFVQYRGTFPYVVEVIQDDKTINAFCTPGGYIYVYTGLMKALDNEATLAGVMGHEIAHAERRHGTSRMTKAYGLQMVLQIALGQNPSQIATIGANLFSGLALLKNSRLDEEDADNYSFKYLQSTPWYPGSIKFFFEKIVAASGKAPSGSQSAVANITTSVERLLSTHPLPQDRIDATNKRIDEAKLPPPTEANLRAIPYQRIKQMLP